MNITLEVLAFIGGTLILGLRSWFGKMMVQAVFWLLKRILKITEEEAAIYMQQRDNARQSGKIRVAK